MDLHEVPLGQRFTIVLCGLRNRGKSSLFNALIQQNMALVSPIKGTTTDPVQKAMELFPLGPVNIIDTPGYDDEGELGLARVAKTKEMLKRAACCLLVLDGSQNSLHPLEEELLALIKKQNLPYFIVVNKQDLGHNLQLPPGEKFFPVSCTTNSGLEELRQALGKIENPQAQKSIVADLLTPQATVVLVTPIDSSAPKGRLILPQQQVLRELLDYGHFAMVTQAYNLQEALSKLANPPDLVITDSQAFGEVAQIVPSSIPLTSFSILMARYKGELEAQLAGIKALEKIKPGDKILIGEGCSHHRQCDDIGTVKIPRWLNEKAGGPLEYDFYAGGDFPTDCSKYQLMVLCGGCMLTPQQVKSRVNAAREHMLPVTNYGMLIAWVKGILPRALAPLQKLKH